MAAWSQPGEVKRTRDGARAARRWGTWRRSRCWIISTAPGAFQAECGTQTYWGHISLSLATVTRSYAVSSGSVVAGWVGWGGVAQTSSCSPDSPRAGMRKAHRLLVAFRRTHLVFIRSSSEHPLQGWCHFLLQAAGAEPSVTWRHEGPWSSDPASLNQLTLHFMSPFQCYNGSLLLLHPLDWSYAISPDSLRTNIFPDGYYGEETCVWGLLCSILLGTPSTSYWRYQNSSVPPAWPLCKHQKSIAWFNRVSVGSASVVIDHLSVDVSRFSLCRHLASLSLSDFTSSCGCLASRRFARLGSCCLPAWFTGCCAMVEVW